MQRFWRTVHACTFMSGVVTIAGKVANDNCCREAEP